MVSQVPQAIIQKAKKVELVIFDVDGVLSDGTLYFFDKDLECKGFHVHDGLGLELLQKSGISVAIITKRSSPLLEKRMTQLGIKHFFQGQSDKRIAYQSLLETLSLTDEQVAYVGDDVIDLPVMVKVGLSIAVKNAVDFVVEKANWQTERKGGKGAAREVCEMILSAKGLLQPLLEHYCQ